MIKGLLEKLKPGKLPRIPPALIRWTLVLLLIVFLGGGSAAIIVYNLYQPQIKLLKSKDPDRYVEMNQAAKNLDLVKAYDLYRELEGMTMDDVYALRYQKWKDRLEADKEFRSKVLQARSETHEALREKLQKRYALRVAHVAGLKIRRDQEIQQAWEKSSSWEKGLMLRFACIRFLEMETIDLGKQQNLQRPPAREPFRVQGKVRGKSESELCNEWIEVRQDPESVSQSLRKMEQGMNYYYFSRLMDEVGLSREAMYTLADRATKMAGDFETF